ncbi:M20/M25/M40 family metallo-hydrolase [Leifsonia sp. McL0607]|uniref:M20/M25/M40 family metallo-hydrolase n=1 Tax=Leifsonia sp. McL0607 TaxID=3415672 RepID=UPI003CEBF9BE
MVGFEGATEDGTKYKGYNIIVDVVKGRSDNVVMFGAHYDSIGVPGVDAKTPPSDATSTSTPQFGSPGMNDNASGVAALLSIAASNVGAKDRVKTLRLAFWDAEEQGLKGSRNYVESLSDADKSTLSAYVNADMLATKGGIVSIVDADKSGSATYDESAQSWAEDLTFSPEEVELEKQLRNAYPAGTEFLESFDAVTGSDGNPFHLAGVPTTGIGTVSKDPKVYLAPCYHQACDDITNIDNDVLAKNEKALNGLALTLTTS